MKIASEILNLTQINEYEPVSPAEIFTLFRKEYSLEEAKQKLAEWLEVALTTENLFYDDAKSREELYRFYHLLTYVSEGIWQLPENKTV